MNHHLECNCAACKPPKPHPAACPAILLPRIIARGKTWLHRTCFALQVAGIACHLQPPYALVSVAPGGEPRWEPAPDGRPLHYLAEIPLLCQVRDACGCCAWGQASIRVEICLTPTCPLPECWRSCLMLLPSVRLICAPCSQDACFDAQLEVCLEGYLLRWEAHATGEPCKPRCPELPLYPQPNPYCM